MISPLLLWTFAYAEDGSVEGCGSSGVYDGDLEPVDCAVLFLWNTRRQQEVHVREAKGPRE